jgi:hypothetical protein
MSISMHADEGERGTLGEMRGRRESTQGEHGEQGRWWMRERRDA